MMKNVGFALSNYRRNRHRDSVRLLHFTMAFQLVFCRGLDHYIKERLGAVHYMRSMDDMVIFGSNKKVLHRTRQAISDYLENELGLSLKRQLAGFSVLV